MSVKFGIYKCNICGNVVQVFEAGAGELICCGEEMELLSTQYEENEIGEKHVPVIDTVHEGCETGVCTEATYVSLNKHPMTKEHYIQFIEVMNQEKNEIRIKFFKPEETPVYNITGFCEKPFALELCNVHGLWRSK
jgi:superoxide reductase